MILILLIKTIIYHQIPQVFHPTTTIAMFPTLKLSVKLPKNFSGSFLFGWNLPNDYNFECKYYPHCVNYMKKNHTIM